MPAPENPVPDRGRRALLRGRLRSKPPMRPPWALPESGFVAACIACNACVDACPQHVLAAGDGGLPEFDPMRGECTFCGDCANACGEHAFQAVDREPWSLRAQVGEACLTGRGIVCFSCRDACGESAIAFPPTRTVPRPQVQADRCTGCGACVPACPGAAISLAESSIEVPLEA